MTDKELIRRALLGDQEAQKECTEKGIVLPCPFCGNEKPIISTREICRVWCPNCLAKAAGMFTQQGALAEWNTRPAPPVGKCGECALWKEEKECPGSFCCTITGMERESNNFCSEFDLREE